jgi:hypothetical protein
MKRIHDVVFGSALALALVCSVAIGAEKCKMCHNSDAKGAQYKQWAASKHSQAYATLASEEAKTIAAGKKIADPQKSDECLQCHVTAHGVAAAKLTQKYAVEQGVGCESCHGPGGDYWKLSIMKDQAKAVAAGLVIPKMDVCATCHNDKSPTFKGFDAKAMWAKIAHPNPQKAASK